VPVPVPVAGADGRRRFWRRRGVLVGGLFTVLGLCGVIILALVRRQTGTEGFLVGAGLACLPVPVLGSALLWLDRVAPTPWRDACFAFAWGACAATLVALLANEYATHLLAITFTATPSQTNAWGATFVAPLVEESAKGSAVLLLFLYRRRDFGSLVDGIVIAGLSATGFAFTENILYLGSAFGVSHAYGNSAGPVAATAGTFFVRVVLTPFAHPLFTSMTGTGFAISAISRPGQARRWLAPLGGWITAMALHGTWNGSATLSPLGFIGVYAVVMVPLLGLIVWLALWARGNELRTVRRQLPLYASAGWFSPPEVLALGSMKVRSAARTLARHRAGDGAVRTVREYQEMATSLALLRGRAARGAEPPDFAERERELLDGVWSRRPLAQQAHTQALVPPRPLFPHPYPMPHPGFPAPYGQPWPARFPAQRGAYPQWPQPGGPGPHPGPRPGWPAAPAGHPHPGPYGPYAGPGPQGYPYGPYVPRHR
jgi:RsiW-degrading membrane proteinase PrsW (M82 family)